MTLGQEFGAYAMHPGRGPAAAPGGPGAAARGQPRRHRDRHRAQRPSRVPAARRHRPAAPRSPASTRWSRRPIWSRPPPTSAHFVQLSGVLKRVAVKLSKICNDLRLLSSGPARRIRRDQPARPAGRLVDHAREGQPGDPRGGQSGRLRGDRQRRHGHLRRRGRPAAAQCVRADHRALACSPASTTWPRPPRCWPTNASTASPPTANCSAPRVANSIGLVTALSPEIGYENATDVAQEALVSGRGVVEIVAQRGLLSRERIDAILTAIAVPAGTRADDRRRHPHRHERVSAACRHRLPGAGRRTRPGVPVRAARGHPLRRAGDHRSRRFACCGSGATSTDRCSTVPAPNRFRRSPCWTRVCRCPGPDWRWRRPPTPVRWTTWPGS